MKFKFKYIVFVLVAALSSPLALSASAAPDVGNDALATKTTNITLIQAITAAEKYAVGKASRAELERHQDQWVFDVEVVSGKKVTDVKVDPKNGKVIAATEDEVDRDDQSDKED